MASVRRRWSRLSAPSASSRSPRRPRSRGQRHSLPGSLSLSRARSSSSPRLCHCFGELMCSCLGISGEATPPRAPLASPHHRRRIGCSCRASVSPHCLLRRELTLPEFRHGHQCRGQGSVVQHFFSFLFQKLRLVIGVSFARSPTRDADGRPHTTVVPPFARARSLGAVELGFLVPIVAEESEEHDGALGRRRDLAVDEISGGQASPLFSGH